MTAQVQQPQRVFVKPRYIGIGTQHACNMETMRDDIQPAMDAATPRSETARGRSSISHILLNVCDPPFTKDEVEDFVERWKTGKRKIAQEKIELAKFQKHTKRKRAEEVEQEVKRLRLRVAQLEGAQESEEDD